MGPEPRHQGAGLIGAEQPSEGARRKQPPHAELRERERMSGHHQQRPEYRGHDLAGPIDDRSDHPAVALAVGPERVGRVLDRADERPRTASVERMRQSDPHVAQLDARQGRPLEERRGRQESVDGCADVVGEPG